VSRCRTHCPPCSSPRRRRHRNQRRHSCTQSLHRPPRRPSTWAPEWSSSSSPTPWSVPERRGRNLGGKSHGSKGRRRCPPYNSPRRRSHRNDRRHCCTQSPRRPSTWATARSSRLRSAQASWWGPKCRRRNSRRLCRRWDRTGRRRLGTWPSCTPHSHRYCNTPSRPNSDNRRSCPCRRMARACTSLGWHCRHDLGSNCRPLGRWYPRSRLRRARPSSGHRQSPCCIRSQRPCACSQGTSW